MKNDGFKYKMGMMREYFRIPNNIIMTVTIQGDVKEDDLREVLVKIKKIHPLIGARIALDDKHDAWFTDSDSQPFELKILQRHDEDQWKQVVEIENTLPFNFENGPLIKFLLLKSEEFSDLVVICHHCISDGISLINLVKNILFLLNRPETKIITSETLIPGYETFKKVPVNLKLKKLKNRIVMYGINRKWESEEVIFNEEDYKNVHDEYYNKFNYRIKVAELSSSETSDLIQICRENNITVNSALCVAFLAARESVRRELNTNNKIQIAVNLRDHLKDSSSNRFGFFAGSVNFEYDYNPDTSFWNNSTVFHDTVTEKLGEKDILLPLMGHYISPTLTDAINIATYGRWVSKSSTPKISSFINKNNKPMEISNQIIGNMPGLMMSNLGYIKTNDISGDLKMVKAYFATSPSPYLDLVVNAVTVNNRLTLTMNYMEKDVTNEGKELESILKKAMQKLGEMTCKTPVKPEI